MKKTVKTLLSLSAFVLLAAALTLVYVRFGERPVQGSKAITIEVVSSSAETASYALHTDAEFLRQAMEEAEGLTFSGQEGPYGLMIDTVNGEKADYSADGAYWSFCVNGEYCSYGVSEQPVKDGDAFTIAYTK